MINYALIEVVVTHSASSKEIISFIVLLLFWIAVWFGWMLLCIQIQGFEINIQNFRQLPFCFYFVFWEERFFFVLAILYTKVFLFIWLFIIFNLFLYSLKKLRFGFYLFYLIYLKDFLKIVSFQFIIISLFQYLLDFLNNPNRTYLC